MKVVKIICEPRLTALMRLQGGISVRDALARADAVLVAQRDACLGEIDQALASLGAAGLSAQAQYAAATRILSMCVSAEEASLERAAQSLCELLDGADPAHPPDPRAVAVHIVAMRALHRSPASPKAKASVLAGLNQLAATRR